MSMSLEGDIMSSKKSADEKVLEALTKEWQSTNRVAQKSKVNWYKTESILNNLFFDKKVKRDKKQDIVYWRLK